MYRILNSAKAVKLNFVLIALVGTVMFLISCRGEDQRESPEPLVVKTFQASENQSYLVSQNYIGELEAARKSSLGFEIGGMVSNVTVDEGDSVERGEVLAVLDTERLKARRAELLASQDQARADLELAKITRQRTKEALDLNAVSSQDYDIADKDFQAKAASLERAGSSVKSIDVDIKKSELLSPYDSIITKRFLDEGEVVPAGEAVLEIIESSAPEVRIGIAGNVAGDIEPGEKYIIRVQEKNYQGKVKSVVPQRSGSTRTVDVILTIDGSPVGLRDGELAVLKLERSVPQRGFWLPLSSITESSRGLWSCYVAVPVSDSDKSGIETHRLERRELELLHQESDRVYVQGTLQEGDVVVEEGLQRLVPGQLVKLQAPEAISGGAK